MAAYVKIGTRADMPDRGEAKEFTANGRIVCVANVGGRLAAMDNVCVHRGGPLGQGSVERGKVICPWHGWEFDPFTGAAAHNPEHRAIVYPIKFDGDNVLVLMQEPGSGPHQ